jgi:hypothetical protein
VEGPTNSPCRSWERRGAAQEVRRRPRPGTGPEGPAGWKGTGCGRGSRAGERLRGRWGCGRVVSSEPGSEGPEAPGTLPPPSPSLRLCLLGSVSLEHGLPPAAGRCCSAVRGRVRRAVEGGVLRGAAPSPTAVPGARLRVVCGQQREHGDAQSAEQARSGYSSCHLRMKCGPDGALRARTDALLSPSCPVYPSLPPAPARSRPSPPDNRHRALLFPLDRARFWSTKGGTAGEGWRRRRVRAGRRQTREPSVKRAR